MLTVTGQGTCLAYCILLLILNVCVERLLCVDDNEDQVMLKIQNFTMINITKFGNTHYTGQIHSRIS